MSEFFLELFSEEIPPKFQVDARNKIKILFQQSFAKSEIKYKSIKSFSTPTRLVFFTDGIVKKIQKGGKILKGPRTEATEGAINGFLKSNNLKKAELYEKNLEKGKFYFAKTKLKTINAIDELKVIIPQVLQAYSWEKTMKWSNHNLHWSRPLRSILALFDGQLIKFNFFHIHSSNVTTIGENYDLKPKVIKNFKSYLSLLKSCGVILDQEQRKKIIINKFNKICSRLNLKNHFNDRLINEVINLVENPNIICANFSKEFLEIPNEVLILTMQRHQRYFPLFDLDSQLTNYFLIVANLSDKKGLIKLGNERVIEARLSDAKFFWEKNKRQNLVKQISKLKDLSFFDGLGSVYNKTQRLKKLGAFISNNLILNKERVEIAASICKADLVSDIVGEYPELQGVMGKYFSKIQGFEDEVSLAISDHYLPIGLNSPVPKKPISCAIAIIDKIDNLVGFYGVNEKPTSSKDPFALRRSAIGLLRIIIENNLTIQLKDLINYSINLYAEQNIKLNNPSISKEILVFLRERVKNLMKEKKIRADIIEAAIASHTGDDFLSLKKKCLIMNKNITKEIGKNIVSTYKRVSNILDQEVGKQLKNITGEPDSILFVKSEEKFLFDKINEIRRYFSKTNNKDNYEEMIKILSEIKPTTDSFFDNVVVNDENLSIKKNRLELLQMFCKTYNNFIDFSKVEGA